MPKGVRTPENRWQRIEYWIKRNPDKTLEECEQMRAEKLLISKQNHPNNIEYWKKNYAGLSERQYEELLTQYKKENNYQHIEYWIKRNPDKTLEECEQMMEHAKQAYLAKRPDNNGINNPRHRSKTTFEERQECSPNSIKFYIKRNPDKTLEECEELLNKYKIELKKKHVPTNTCTCIEYWIAKGYSLEDAKIKLKERQHTFSLEKCIEKYGKEEGYKKWKDRQDRWKKSLQKSFELDGDNRTPMSNFEKQCKEIICKRLQINVPKKQKYISDKNCHYSFDLTINNKIIEFNGDYWHMNPKLYNENDINKTTKEPAYIIWEYDKRKKECAEAHGYEVLTIWEHDWNENKDDVIETCINFINN